MKSSNSPQTYLFGILMLLSGFAGISYEILYGRILGHMLGDQFIVSASVLMTFLLGIGAGAWWAHRLWRFLWLIEAGIGLYGLLIAFNQPLLESWIYQSASLTAGGLWGSVLICVVLLFVPAYLMGCSVPLFAGYLKRMSGSESSFSRVYTLYNAGAAFTALWIEFTVIRSVGITGAVGIFAAMNLLIACLLKWRFDAMAQTNMVEASYSYQKIFKMLPKHVWLALVLASMASAVFQLWMVKYAELIFGPFRESFALVLALILAGIALGSWLSHRFHWSFSRLMLLNVFALLFSCLLAAYIPYVYAALYAVTEHLFVWVIILKALMLLLLMLPVAVLFGATVPALLSHRQEVSHASGALLACSSFANVLGFLLMVFVLHPYLDYGAQWLVVVVLTCVAWAVVQRHALRTWLAMGCAVLGMSWVYATQWDEDLLYLSYTNFKNYEKLKEAREGVSFPDRYKGYQDVFSINWMDGSPFFFINGYISIPLNNPSEKIVGGLSTLFAPKVNDALVLGLGSGATASTVGLFFKHTSVVEINPVVRDNLFRMQRWNFDIEHNPRVDIRVDDAIHFVKSSTKKYDLILNTVTTPLYFSSSKLYTSDFFGHVQQRLSSGGVYVTWMDSRIGDKGADIILRSLHQHFKYGALVYVKSSYFLLLASNQPLVMHQQKLVVGNQQLRDNLMHKHSVMSAWLPYQLMTTDVFSLIAEPNGVLNTDDYPALEFEMAGLQYSGIHDFKQRLLAQMKVNTIRDAMSFVPDDFPAPLIFQAMDRLHNTSITRRWQKLIHDTDGAIDLADLERRTVQAEVRNTAKAWHHLAYQLIKLEHYKQAIAAIQHELTLNPNMNDAYYNLAVCYESLHQDTRALHAFEQELSIDPKDEDVRYRIARILVRQGAYRRALSLLNDDIRMQNLKRGKVFFYRALVFHALGDDVQARQDLAKAMHINQQERKMLHDSGMLGDMQHLRTAAEYLPSQY